MLPARTRIADKKRRNAFNRNIAKLDPEYVQKLRVESLRAAHEQHPGASPEVVVREADRHFRSRVAFLLDAPDDIAKADAPAASDIERVTSMSEAEKLERIKASRLANPSEADAEASAAARKKLYSEEDAAGKAERDAIADAQIEKARRGIVTADSPTSSTTKREPRTFGPNNTPIDDETFAAQVAALKKRDAKMRPRREAILERARFPLVISKLKSFGLNGGGTPDYLAAPLPGNTLDRCVWHGFAPLACCCTDATGCQIMTQPDRVELVELKS